MSEQRVLCVPRRCVENQEPFTPWGSADWLLHAAETGMRWLPRHEAEASTEFIQPIPCALVVGEQKGYYVFRRINEGRADLKARLSLIVGGHIDWEADTPEFPQLVQSTLTREIPKNCVPTSQPRSPQSAWSWTTHRSNHLDTSALCIEVVVNGSVKPLAKEEFSVRSRLIGRQYSTLALRRLRRIFDPWSAIIFCDYLAPSHALDVGRQARLL